MEQAERLFRQLREKVEVLTGERDEKNRAVRYSDLDTLLEQAFNQLIPVTVRKERLTTAANTSSATLSNLLAIDLPTSGVFWFRAGIIFSTVATTTGIKLGVTLPAGAAIHAQIRIPQAADGTAAVMCGEITASGDSVMSTDAPAGNHIAIIEGIVSSSTTFGQLTLQFASEVGGSQVTAQVNTHVILEKLV